MRLHDIDETVSYYKELVISDQLSEDLMNFCLDIAEGTIPLLVDRKDHDINEYKEAITQVYNSLVR